MFGEEGERGHRSFVVLLVNQQIPQFLQGFFSFGNGDAVVFVPGGYALIGLPGDLVAPEFLADVRVKGENRGASRDGGQSVGEQIIALLQTALAKDSGSLLNEIIGRT